MRLPTLVAVVVALSLPGPAHAGERVAGFPVNGERPVAGPVPVGSEVVYGHRLRSGRWWLGSTATTYAVLPPPRALDLTFVTLAASAERIAWTRTDLDTGPPGKGIARANVADRLFALWPGGLPRLVDACAGPPGCGLEGGTQFGASVDGSRLGWGQASYPLDTAHVAVDRGDGREPLRIERAYGVRLAGGRVAFDVPAPDRQEIGAGSGGDVVVADGEGRELLRFSSSPGHRFHAGNWALQADGKLIVFTFHGPVWMSPEEPEPHRILDHDPEARVIGAGGDRLVFSDYGPGLLTDRLRVAGLDGVVRTVAVLPRTGLAGAGFDGLTLAWASNRCGAVSIVRARIDEAAAPWRPTPGPCAELPRRRPELVLASARARVFLTCPRGCRGTLAIANRYDPRRTLARARFGFRARPGTRTVRVPLGRSLVRELREGPPPDLTVRLSGRDGTGERVTAERTSRSRIVR